MLFKNRVANRCEEATHSLIVYTVAGRDTDTKLRELVFVQELYLPFPQNDHSVIQRDYKHAMN